MAAPTSNYRGSMKPAYPGLIYDLNESEIVSRDAEGSIEVGFIVSRGTNENQVVAGGSDGIGIAVRDLVGAKADIVGSDDNISYKNEDTIPVMLEGFIWVKNGNGDTVAPGDPVKYNPDGSLNFAAGANTLVNAVVESASDSFEIPVLIRLNGNDN